MEERTIQSVISCEMAGGECGDKMRIWGPPGVGVGGLFERFVCRHMCFFCTWYIFLLLWMETWGYGLVFGRKHNSGPDDSHARQQFLLYPVPSNSKGQPRRISAARNTTKRTTFLYPHSPSGVSVYRFPRMENKFSPFVTSFLHINFSSPRTEKIG